MQSRAYKDRQYCFCVPPQPAGRARRGEGGDVPGMAQGPSCPVLPRRRRGPWWLGSWACSPRTSQGLRGQARVRTEGRSQSSAWEGAEGCLLTVTCFILLLPWLYLFTCWKAVLVAPGFLGCLQISVSFLLERALNANCSAVTEASWRARCSPTS